MPHARSRSPKSDASGSSELAAGSWSDSRAFLRFAAEDVPFLDGKRKLHPANAALAKQIAQRHQAHVGIVRTEAPTKFTVRRQRSGLDDREAQLDLREWSPTSGLPAGDDGRTRGDRHDGGSNPIESRRHRPAAARSFGGTRMPLYPLPFSEAGERLPSPCPSPGARGRALTPALREGTALAPPLLEVGGKLCRSQPASGRRNRAIAGEFHRPARRSRRPRKRFRSVGRGERARMSHRWHCRLRHRFSIGRSFVLVFLCSGGTVCGRLGGQHDARQLPEPQAPKRGRAAEILHLALRFHVQSDEHGTCSRRRRHGAKADLLPGAGAADLFRRNAAELVRVESRKIRER